MLRMLWLVAHTIAQAFSEQMTPAHLILKAIYSTESCLQAIPGLVIWEEAGVYNVSGGCEAVHTLPPLTFTINGTDYTLTPEQYILQVSSTTSRAGQVFESKRF